MVPDQNKTCLGLKYFCFEGDGLWTMTDDELVELGKAELEKLGLLNASEVEDGAVVRMPKAYPVCDFTYRNALDVVRGFLDGLGNLQLVGRNGMHKYNNQDHAMSLMTRYKITPWDITFPKASEHDVGIRFHH